MGGAEAVRAAVVAGAAPCVDLADPERIWVVVDKIRPYDPIDFRPADLGPVQGVRSLSSGWLRAGAGAAMTKLVAGAREAGVGELAIESAFRSHATQVTSYGNQVAARGQEGADAVSARPGFSEHQSGLAADVVACDGRCSGLDALAATAQGEWLAENSWRYGWIVRYEACCTETTGYEPEPWHLRYIGVQLATAYHEGGFQTLEEFWGLPPAPDYRD
jgi:D-alanyl-D-alanine carboxypeptidase